MPECLRGRMISSSDWMRSSGSGTNGWDGGCKRGQSCWMGRVVCGAGLARRRSLAERECRAGITTDWGNALLVVVLDGQNSEEIDSSQREGHPDLVRANGGRCGTNIATGGRPHPARIRGHVMVAAGENHAGNRHHSRLRDPDGGDAFGQSLSKTRGEEPCGGDPEDFQPDPLTHATISRHQRGHRKENRPDDAGHGRPHNSG
jgi:hypothetical protein